MLASDSTSNPHRGSSSTQGKVAFLVAAVLTGTLLIMGITGTPWPHWLLVLTNIL